MKNLILIALSCLTFGGTLLAQNVDFKAANFKDDKEGLKAAMESIKEGDVHRDAGYLLIVGTKGTVPTMERALFHYEKAYKFNPKSSELNYKMGSCLLYTNRKYEAWKYLDAAKTLGGDLPKDFNFYYGQGQQLTGEFSAAAKSLKAFQEEASGKQVEELGNWTKKYIKECKSAQTLVGAPERVWIDNLKAVNSALDDFSPCISTDGAVLMFTSVRSNGHTANDIGGYDADIYTSTYENKAWESPKAMGSAINTIDDDMTGNLAYDGQSMLLIRSENGNADMYEAKLTGRTWGGVAPSAKAINTEYNQTFASYSFDGVKLYFVTDQKGGGGKAGNDIFFSGRMAMGTGQYGKPQTAGSQVNTKYHEGSVFMTPDGKHMIFSSQGHNSMGGYDIFMAKWHQGQWLAPVNLGYPINTPYDDLFFAQTANGKHAYISSNREGGSGGLDIYKVTFWGPEKEVVYDTEDFLLASMAVPVTNISIEKPVVVDKKSLTVFKGKTIDAITKKPIEANMEILDLGVKEVVNNVTTNSATGKFLLSLPAGKNYSITVDKTGYLFHSENFNLPADDDFNMVDKTIEMYNIAVGSKIALRNVFFASGKAEITGASYPELDRLVKLLKDVPGLKIELSGHTDDRGSVKNNTTLSQNRAQAVVDYLVKKGVAAGRMTAVGYGPSQPVSTNATAEGRQDNRRTEFLITAN
jgi:outer membrane protein OmpA-like peptidoglycan-associated protein/Tol biopolymer transport system component